MDHKLTPVHRRVPGAIAGSVLPAELELLARPSRRTALEFLLSVWLFGTNDDFVGQTLEADPMVGVEGRLTRDILNLEAA
jgi:hypothetical protein